MNRAAVRNGLLRVLRKVLPAGVVQIRLPQRRYIESAVRLAPFSGGLRYTIERPHADEVEARKHNLDTILDLFEENSVEYFVVRSDWRAPPVLGVPEGERDHVVRQLRQFATSIPLYLRVTNGDPRGRQSFRPSHSLRADQLGTTFVAFSYLVDPVSGRRFGDSEGCTIQFWDETNDDLQFTAAGNRHAGHVSASSRRHPHSVEVYGRRSTTYAPLGETGLFSVTFPIDVVYMWVDGDDPAWRARRSERMGIATPSVARDANDPTRFRQFDELRYSLRSLERFAPWVRKVFLVTDNQRPTWLDETDSNLEVIDHREILPASALPTFNSHAISSSLHRIPGLADHFLVMNDDVFFGRLVPPERFFHSNGVARFFLSRTRINTTPEVPHECARLRTCDLIGSATGVKPEHVMKHTPVAFIRDLLQDLEEEFPNEWKETVHNPFRSESDIVPEYLHHYIGYHRKMTTPGTIGYGYFGFGSSLGRAGMKTYRAGRPSEVFCVNDLGGDPSRADVDHAELIAFLRSQFPHTSQYERN